MLLSQSEQLSPQDFTLLFKLFQTAAFHLLRFTNQFNHNASIGQGVTDFRCFDPGNRFEAKAAESNNFSAVITVGIDRRAKNATLSSTSSNRPNGVLSEVQSTNYSSASIISLFLQLK